MNSKKFSGVPIGDTKLRCYLYKNDKERYYLLKIPFDDVRFIPENKLNPLEDVEKKLLNKKGRVGEKRRKRKAKKSN